MEGTALPCSTVAPVRAACAQTPVLRVAATGPPQVRSPGSSLQLSRACLAATLAAATRLSSSLASPSQRGSGRAHCARLCRKAADGKGSQLPWHAFGKWEIHKFGGASLETAELYKICGDLLLQERGRSDPVVPTAAIVSAAGGMTDALVSVVSVALEDLDEAETRMAAVAERQISITTELLGESGADAAAPVIANIQNDVKGVLAMLKAASLMRSVPPQMLELVAGLGEVWSAQTLAAYIGSTGTPSAWVDARDVLIVSDASSDKGLGEKGASIETIDIFFDDSAEKLSSWWKKEFPDDSKTGAPLLIVTGFVCSTRAGRPTTLKRSGSDYSATVFAKIFDSSKVTMWKNVDGVYSADPRMVSKASSIPSMTFDEAMELAYFGGQVLHPSAMIPCIEKRIPVDVRNVFNPSHPGTRVYGRGDDWLRWDDQDDDAADAGKQLPVKALTSIEKVSLVTLTGASFLGTPGVARRMMEALSNAGVNVILASQGSSEHSITVAVNEDYTSVAVSSVSEAFKTEIAEKEETRVTSRDNVSILAVIGEGMKNTPGVSAKFFTALAAAKVNVIAIAQGSSERNVSVVVDRAQLKDALQSAHDGFDLTQD